MVVLTHRVILTADNVCVGVYYPVHLKPGLAIGAPTQAHTAIAAELIL